MLQLAKMYQHLKLFFLGIKVTYTITCSANFVLLYQPEMYLVRFPSFYYMKTA